jgi:DNA repair protein RAD16
MTDPSSRNSSQTPAKPAAAASSADGESSLNSTRRKLPTRSSSTRNTADQNEVAKPEPGSYEWFQQKNLSRRAVQVKTDGSSSNSDAGTSRSSSSTPATSAINTPATSNRTSKRKRSIALVDPPSHSVTADELLAQQLQAEEDAELEQQVKEDEEEDEEDEEDEEEEDILLSRPRKRRQLPPRTRGKGKAVARPAVAVESNDEQDAISLLSSDLSPVPDDIPGDSDSEEFVLNESEDNDEFDEDEKAEAAQAAQPTTEQDVIVISDDEAVARIARRSATSRAARTGRLDDHRGPRTKSERDWRLLCRHHPMIKTMWADLEAAPTILPEQSQQPLSISRQLKPFQLEGLHWMIEQEKTKYRGGLLGDEMGMGKTIQAVSLIMSDYPAPHPTLVVIPPVALVQWQNEINDYTSGVLKVFIYHGPKARKETIKSLKKYNVILTTYSGLESLYRKEQKGWNRKDMIVKEDSILHELFYHRIILDEAHSIKSRTSNTSKACFALKSTYRWCLSGTPLQNRIGELFSLLRFIEVDPFAYYLCRKCTCKSIHWNMIDRSKCKDCGHSPTDHVSLFNRELLDPIQRFGNSGLGQSAFQKLRILTDRIMLRRVKKDHVGAMELPPKDIDISRNFFGEAEQDFASSIMSNTARKFDNYVARGVLLNNYANIFGLIMQMRQLADHPDLMLKKSSDGSGGVLICTICDDVAEDAIRSACRDVFCRGCVKNYIDNYEGAIRTEFGVPARSAECPRCHVVLSINLDQPEIEQEEDNVKKSSIVNRIDMGRWTSSTKIEMLVSELASLRSRKQTSKSIIFSQFTSMLQLIEWRLHRAGLQTVMLDGSMTPAQRAGSIKYFMENVGVDVFLVSLKAGGVALNLTEASKVYIVDP